MAARKTPLAPAAEQEQTEPVADPAPAPVTEPGTEPKAPQEPKDAPAAPQDEPKAEKEQEPQERTAVENAYIAALRREREGYLRYGQQDRAGGVETELKRLSAPLELAVTRPPETA